VGKIIGVSLAVAACLYLFLAGCGPKPKPPVTGADLVATAVAAKYRVNVDGVKEVGGEYEWTVSAVNGSEYSWKGTLYVELVNAANEIIESHDFEIKEMVAPGDRTRGLKFTSRYAPLEKGGTVEALKVEVDVADYREPAGG
jgi:hypothetical protein